MDDDEGKLDGGEIAARFTSAALGLGELAITSALLEPLPGAETDYRLLFIVTSTAEAVSVSAAGAVGIVAGSVFRLVVLTEADTARRDLGVWRDTASFSPQGDGICVRE